MILTRFLTRSERADLDRLMKVAPVGLDARIIGVGPVWRVEVLLEDQWMILFTAHRGTPLDQINACGEALDMYESQPHVIESAWGDPVLVN